MLEEENRKFTLLFTVYIYFNRIPNFPGRATPDASTFFQVLGRRDDQKARNTNTDHKADYNSHSGSLKIYALSCNIIM